MTTSTAKATPIRRGRRPIQLALMLVLPSVLLGACSITDRNKAGSERGCCALLMGRDMGYVAPTEEGSHGYP